MPEKKIWTREALEQREGRVSLQYKKGNFCIRCPSQYKRFSIELIGALAAVGVVEAVPSAERIDAVGVVRCPPRAQGRRRRRATHLARTRRLSMAMALAPASTCCRNAATDGKGMGASQVV